MLGTIKKINYNAMMSTDFSTFDLITCCAFDSDNGEMPSYLNREPVMSERYDGSYHNVSSYRYTERFEPKVTFLKKDFSNFTREELRAVLSWLTSLSTPSVADFYDNIYSMAPVFCAIGGWTDIQIRKLANGRVVGVVATFSSVHPWALSPINTITKTITTPTTFTMKCDNDDSSYIYPRVIVEHNGVVVQVDKAMTTQAEMVLGTVYKYNNMFYWIDANKVLHQETTNNSGFTTTSVEIHNATTKTKTVVRNSQSNEKIIIDGANRIIQSKTYPTRTFGDNFGRTETNDQWQWLALVDGDNKITITGNCTVTIEYRSVMKVGEW